MKKILTIEDDNTFGAVLVESLQDEGFTVERVAEGGDAAIAAVKKFAPDLIVSDIMLPKLSGVETLRKLKADPLTSGIPVIMLSSLEHDESITTALSFGAATYFVKSQHPLKEIVEKIKQFLVAA